LKSGEDDRFHLAFSSDSKYALHGAAPFTVEL
jgi:hypothetical protein